MKMLYRKEIKKIPKKKMTVLFVFASFVQSRPMLHRFVREREGGDL